MSEYEFITSVSALDAAPTGTRVANSSLGLFFWEKQPDGTWLLHDDPYYLRLIRTSQELVESNPEPREVLRWGKTE